ncbi:MAG: hypothetical protein ACOX1Q_01870 [Eubacteriales bacterium]|jgi:hypothetical protein
MKNRTVLLVTLFLITQMGHAVAAEERYLANKGGNAVEYTDEGGTANVETYRIVKYREHYTDCYVENKRYLFENGDEFLLRKFCNSDGIEKVVYTIYGKNGSVTYIDQATGEWISSSPTGDMTDAVLFIQTDESFVILGPAAIYKPYGDGNLLDTGLRGSVNMCEVETGYEVTIRLPLSDGNEAHIWALSIQNPEYEWNDIVRSNWKRIDFNADHRICFDGAYYISPESYKPYESGMFYRCPAVHPAIVLLEEDSRVANILSVVLLDEAVKKQNRHGYWPTPAESRWLREDYHIGSHFYDTRFNNDVTMRLFEAYKKLGYQHYLGAALRQTEWLICHASKNHIKVEDGILVEDYGVPKGDRKVKQTHSSLNHQLQEIKVLLTAHECTGESNYYEFAEELLSGIRSAESKWYNGNRGLAYAIKPDGTPGLNDYPYLTYNDLYDVQEILSRVDEERDPVLDRLMAYKLKHMLENDIIGYKTYSDNEIPPLLRAVINDYNKSE